MKRAVFLDRDGTLVVDIPYLSEADKLALVPGAEVALRQLRQLGFELILVTNQAGVGRGFFPLSALAQQHRRLQELLAEQGVPLDAIYDCPHHPDADCACRKPKPGMLLAAAAARQLDLRRCWMIGDKESDVQAGQAAGCRTILLAASAGTTVADFVATDLVAAANQIAACETLTPASPASGLHP